MTQKCNPTVPPPNGNPDCLGEVKTLAINASSHSSELTLIKTQAGQIKVGFSNGYQAMPQNVRSMGQMHAFDVVDGFSTQQYLISSQAWHNIAMLGITA